MNHPSRLETNFRRLLSQCNRLVAEGKFQEWRLETYVSSLESMLLDLKQNPSCPEKEVMADYSRQVEFLKGVLRADKLPTPSEKAMAHQLIPRGFTVSNEKITKEIHLKTSEKYTDEMRKELLGNDGVRHRTVSDSPDEDYDTILKYHQTMQEKVAEEMVLFARNLKENSLLAGAIVRKDTEMVEKSSKLTDQNYDRLKVESSRLEQHTKQGCSYWIWLMLILVCATFISMVMFMKVFTKSK